MPRLVLLDLSSKKINKLSGELQIHILPSLWILKFNDKQLTGIEKSFLSSGLMELNLNKNKLKGLDEDFFSKSWSKVCVDCLSENDLTMTITKVPFPTSFLKIIDWSRNESIQIANKVYTEICGSFESLRYFDRDYNEQLANMPHFSKLIIRKLTLEVVRMLQRVYRGEFEHKIHMLETYCLYNCSIRFLKKDPDSQASN